MNSVVSQAGIPAGGKNPDVVDATEVAQLSDTRTPIRMGFWVLVVGFGLALAWAAWAPLDEGVAASAVVSVESRRNTIQHVQGGVVHQVRVRDGSIVKAGDVLIELDAAASRAGNEAIRQNYFSQRALEGRLLAEISGAASISFHPDLLTASNPVAVQLMAVQQQSFAARRSAQLSDLAAGEQTIAGLEAQLAGLRQMSQSRRAQQALQAQQVQSVRALADEGFAPRNQALQLEQAQAELRTSLADLDANIARVQTSIAEARLRILQRRGEYAKEASTELATVRREVQANQERLLASGQELQRMQISSPVDGQVLGLAISGVGGVVQPGQHLMDIVPAGQALRLDVRIPPHVIDRIKVGDEVEVRFSAFAATPHLVVLGRLLSLSGDALPDPASQSGATYFSGRVELTEEGVRALEGRTVKPGMTAEVLIRTGERSLLTYLLNPFMKRVSAAMTEH